MLGYVNLDGRTVRPSTSHLERAAYQSGSLPHTDKPKRALVGADIIRYSHTVILDREG